jgi:hypothetical protein
MMRKICYLLQLVVYRHCCLFLLIKILFKKLRHSIKILKMNNSTINDLIRKPFCYCRICEWKFLSKIWFHCISHTTSSLLPKWVCQTLSLIFLLQKMISRKFANFLIFSDVFLDAGTLQGCTGAFPGRRLGFRCWKV